MSVLVNFRIDEKLKCDMDKVCKNLGTTMSAAFNMFARDLVKNKTFNFSLNKKIESGISFSGLFSKLDSKTSIKNSDSNDSALIVKKQKANQDIFKNMLNSDYNMYKLGKSIMLVPKGDKIESVMEALEEYMRKS